MDAIELLRTIRNYCNDIDCEDCSLCGISSLGDGCPFRVGFDSEPSTWNVRITISVDQAQANARSPLARAENFFEKF